jgi:hypothetical protein
MSDRTEKAKRIVTVRKELHRLAEWKLLDGTHMDTILRNKQNELLSFLDKDAVFTGRFAVTAMLHLHDIARKRAHLEIEREAHARQVLEEGRLLRLSKRMLNKVEQDHRNESQRKDLDEVIDGSLVYCL